MKKYLFVTFALLGLAACSEKENATNTGEVEQSYIAINLLSADADTRAPEDSYGFDEGTDKERAINSAYFFFFDGNGDPFNVNAAAGEPAQQPGGDKNYLSLTITGGTSQSGQNISDIKNAILILKTYKGVYPSKVVAVLNWTPVEKQYTLDQLHEVVDNSLGNDEDGYVMSNSVYADQAGKIVDATPISAENIKKTAAEAEAAPINIYVERTAAKIAVTSSVADCMFDTEKQSDFITLGGLSKEKVFVKIHGWELYNDYTSTNLLKNIDPVWNPATIGLTWNDIPYYRSYWAQSQAGDPDDKFSWQYDDWAAKGYQTKYGFNVASGTKYTNRNTYTYCGENTNSINDTPDYSTKVILKGQLMKKDGANYVPLELARWYGTEYAGNDALRTAVANSVKFTMYYSTDGETFHSIRPEDIMCVGGSSIGVDSYKVGFQLSTTGESNTWYKYDSVNGYVKFGDNGVSGDNIKKANEYLKTIEPALMYNEGQTYYIVDIKHLGQSGKPTEYGVVRNHVYLIDIESIKGYGAPVYSGLDYIVDNPGYPIENESSYVAAKINVLSWKVVKQTVNIVK